MSNNAKNTTSYAKSGEEIKKRVNEILKTMRNENTKLDYLKIDEKLDMIENQLNALGSNYNKNLSKYSKFTAITTNMRNAVVMKRDGILKNLKNMKEKNAATKIQAVRRGVVNRRMAAGMRKQKNNMMLMRKTITNRLNAILEQIGTNNNNSPQ